MAEKQNHKGKNTSSATSGGLFGGENIIEMYKEILASAIPATIGVLLAFGSETINLIFIG